ncbi:hypothetical protein BDN72DRAFT_940560 [Pluteus cervinus]|uniref:Uncharacterized protein n=1 Tax=Pluteus cervinus TaxID=181527 RepID=A0ACD3A4B2_9AGAR|nr:hypothetical protein BDN72DRAFT_940560 [Pluteus cervinus]
MAAEVPDDILHTICEDADLRALALVCKSWSQIATHHLYQPGPDCSIDLEGHEKFLASVSNNDRLSKLVHSYRFGYLRMSGYATQLRLGPLINTALKAMENLQVLCLHGETEPPATPGDVKFSAEHLLGGCSFPKLVTFSWTCGTGNKLIYPPNDREFLESFLKSHPTIRFFHGDSDFSGTLEQQRTVLPNVESIGGPLRFLEQFFTQRESDRPVKRLVWDMSTVNAETDLDTFFELLESTGFGSRLQTLELLGRESSHPAKVHLPALQPTFANIETLVLGNVYLSDVLPSTIERFLNLKRLVVLYAMDFGDVRRSTLVDDYVPEILNWGTTVKEVFVCEGWSSSMRPRIEVEVFTKPEDGSDGISRKVLKTLHKGELPDYDWVTHRRMN